MSEWVLGLTGGIGSGKSAAAACFAGHGIAVVDADVVARQVVEPEGSALGEIARRFGSQVLTPAGVLDRAALRAIIFADEAARRWLEGLLHPLIRAEIRKQLARAASPYAILVSPLLIETSQAPLVQRILVIDVPEALQLARTVSRDGVDEAQVRAILAAQASREARLSRADDVILNDRDPAWLAAEVERLHRYYLTLRGGRP